MKFYAGIGSRDIPESIRREQTRLARILERNGYTLRSGNAAGSDQAFAAGVESSAAQIWLPWENFELEFQKEHPQHDYKVIQPNDLEAFKSVKEFHPVSDKLSHKSCLFMARNFRQVVGLNEPNVDFIIAWTHGGKEMGGTAQAMRIAHSLNIPVLNMFEFNTAEAVINNLTVWHGYRN